MSKCRSSKPLLICLQTGHDTWSSRKGFSGCWCAIRGSDVRQISRGHERQYPSHVYWCASRCLVGIISEKKISCSTMRCREVLQRVFALEFSQLWPVLTDCTWKWHDLLIVVYVSIFLLPSAQTQLQTSPIMSQYPRSVNMCPWWTKKSSACCLVSCIRANEAWEKRHLCRPFARECGFLRLVLFVDISTMSFNAICLDWRASAKSTDHTSVKLSLSTSCWHKLY